MVDEPLEDSHAKKRKPHKKSRTGCIECRRRRVKCGEQKPACHACVRRGAQCEYPPEALISIVPSSSSESTPARTPSTQDLNSSTSFLVPRAFPAICGAQNLPSNSFCIHDMALLHHWTISTSLSIFHKSTDVPQFWQETVPKIAFEHPFVIHAILGLAALHLAYLNCSDNMKAHYLADAASHHNKAMHEFQEALVHIGSDNTEALFMWSTLNLIHVFGMSGRLSGGDGRKEHMLGVQIIPMLRGVEAVLQPAGDALRSGRLGGLMMVGNWFELNPDENPDADDAHFCQTRISWERSVDAQTYDEALWTLRKCRLYIKQFDAMDPDALEGWGFNRAGSGPLMFIIFAPQEYFTLLHQRQPPALILYAFFGALLSTLDDCWFMEGWGRDIVEVVDDLLGNYWRSWIAWPSEVTGFCPG
ncbi:hypothetical protein ACJ41O_011537 [Fusarium nematophilum]